MIAAEKVRMPNWEQEIKFGTLHGKGSGHSNSAALPSQERNKTYPIKDRKAIFSERFQVGLVTLL